ncbi:hypothetical protein BGW80DRAFT_923381 [Lactifluus volemus]|nr:hypothetical protein BGW80DRAFT_923381 [Lactifluus volemus]
MNADISSSLPTSSHPPQHKDGIYVEKVVSSGAEGQSMPQGSPDRIIHGPSPKVTSRLLTFFSFIAPALNGPRCLISNVSSTLGELVPIERHQLTPIVVVVCVETAFLKWIRRSSEDVLSTIFFTFLLGSFAWPAWSHLKRVHCQLSELHGRMEALEDAVRTAKSLPSSPPIDPNPGARIGFEVTEQEQEGSAPEIHVLPVIIKQEDKKHVNTHESSDKTGIPGPDAHARPPITGSRVPPAALHDEPQEHTHNAEKPVQVLTDRVSEQYAGPSVPIQKSSLSGLSPALREIKQQLEQFAEGKLQRLSHLDQRAIKRHFAPPHRRACTHVLRLLLLWRFRFSYRLFGPSGNHTVLSYR